MIKMTGKQGILWIEGKKGWRCKRLSLRRGREEVGESRTGRFRVLNSVNGSVKRERAAS